MVPEKAGSSSQISLHITFMADAAACTLRAGDALKVSSEQEALDLDINANVLPTQFDRSTPIAHFNKNRWIRMWYRHVVLLVSPSHCRDHLGKL